MLRTNRTDHPATQVAMHPARLLAIALSVAACAVPAHVYAQSAASAGKPASSPKAEAPLARGEIVATYPGEKIILMKHGPIANLNMGPMTMEFDLADLRMAKSLKKGDKVRFVAKQVGDDYVITRITLRK